MTDKTAAALLARIIEDNPDATEKEWRQLFVAEAMRDPELCKDIAHEVFMDIVRRQRH